MHFMQVELKKALYFESCSCSISVHADTKTNSQLCVISEHQYSAE